jgi:multiple sugar transport system ATP-binding protein
MRREIARLHQELKVTMIYVTHDQVEAMTLGDRIVVMNRGHVMQIDTPINLYERPKNKFVAGFIGNPAMNFIEGAVAETREPGGGTRAEGAGRRQAGGGTTEEGSGTRDDGGGSAGALKFAAANGTWELPLPTRVGESLTSARGKAVTLGIRPEDLSVVAGPGVAPATTTARLDLVESLGNETFIYARAGKHDLTARLSPPQPLPPLGSNIVLSFNLERAHFFDAVSGERIG